VQTRDPGCLLCQTGVPHLRCTAYALHRARDKRYGIFTGYTGFSPDSTRATSLAHLVCSSLSASTE